MKPLKNLWFCDENKGPLTSIWDDVRTCVRTCVRTYVRASRWEILFLPYLVVGLSLGTEFGSVYVTRINDGNQILKFLGIDNNCDFQNSRFF